MSHSLVKIFINQDGEQQENPKWHLVVPQQGTDVALCTGEVFRFGDAEVSSRIKIVERGGITCENCLKIIKEMKSIKL